MLRDAPGALELPVAPDWWSAPPAGTWEEGFRLSLHALAAVAGRPGVFAAADRAPADVEFRL